MKYGNEKNIAVFGGSFNPPTVAHQEIIAACLEQPAIDEVWAMPSGIRADKDIATRDQDRISMLETMRAEVFGSDPRLVMSDFELRLPRPTRTVRTVGALALAYPEHRFRFVFGADAYAGMPAWSGGEELLRTLPVLLIPRAGFGLPPESDLVSHLKLGPAGGPDVSSTLVRTRARCGQPIGGLVCESVRSLIISNDLYVAA